MSASILDAPRHSKHYDPKVGHHVCRAMDVIFDMIIREQDSGESYVAMAMRHEFGESFTACVMQAVEIRRLRQKHDLKTRLGTQEATGADYSQQDPLGR